ncbi:MAG: DUF4342 domain-containing protein [Oscillospiraceae bacterium]|nr:DUF4342 domain-containing protein [Oscillospiraceae bacterium]
MTLFILKDGERVERHEMAEKLVEKCGITYEEAAWVLEQVNYDLLDAMIYLERQGKLNGNQNRYSTAGGFNFFHDKKTAADAETPGEFFRILLQKLEEILKSSVSYHLIVLKDGTEILSIPLIAVAIILIVASVPALMAVIISFVCGVSYTIEKR